MTINPYADDPWSKLLKIIVTHRIREEDAILKAMDMYLQFPVSESVSDGV